MKGYQFLEQDFFDLCKTRKISRIPMLLYIYLRGLYCRFQKPDFFWSDKEIETHLGLNHKALQRARLTLQEKGLIRFISGKGTKPTTYLMLGTVLLPERMDNKTIGSGHTKHKGYGHNVHTNNTIKERVKNRIGKPESFRDVANRYAKERGWIK